MVAPAQQANTKADSSAINLGQASLLGITTVAGLPAARRFRYWHQRRLRECDQEGTEVPALSTLVDKAAQAAQVAT
ncbi:hypothetical protein ACWGJB_40610 [Streptomyces sp. NPDC054813]